MVDKNYYLASSLIRPEWTQFEYFLSKNNVQPAAELDQSFINLDASGASGGLDTVDIRNSTYAADIHRSASANTAIANLVGKGWTILR